MNSSTRLKMDEAICGRVWASRDLPRLMDTLCYEIGARPMGGEGIAAARDLLSADLSERGADVRAERVPVRAWDYAPCRVEMIAPIGRAFEAYQFLHSAAASVTGPLVEAGNGWPEDVARLGDRCKGAVALIPKLTGSVGLSTWDHHRIRVQNLTRAGAAAVLVRSPQDAQLHTVEMLEISGTHPIPVAGISFSSAIELARLARTADVQVIVKTGGAGRPATCANLLADLSPDSGTDEMIVLGAHLDTHHNSPGAFDNLTGVLTVMEIVRALAPLRKQFLRSLRAVIFTGEEVGMVGSKAYVSAHREELDRVAFMFNCDSLFPDTARGIAVMWSPRMRDVLEECLQESSREVVVQNAFCMSSDYLPFMLEGIPTARPASFHDPFPPVSHTVLDTPDRVPLDWIRLNASRYAPMLMRLLIKPGPLPGKRLSPDEVHRQVERQNAREALVQGLDFHL